MTEFIPDSKNVSDIKSQTEERLKAAKVLFNMNLYNDSVSRSYYAVFSAVSLLFYVKGKSYSSHKGIIINFHKDFIRTGIFPLSFGSLFSNLFQKRQDCDYDSSIKFDKEAAAACIGEVETMIHTVFNYIRKNHPDLLAK